MAKIKRHQSKGSDKALAHIRAQRGLDRKRYFAEGGELSRWRGLRLVQADEVKKRNKNACRGPRACDHD